jgi:hypothetical protein
VITIGEALFGNSHAPLLPYSRLTAPTTARDLPPDARPPLVRHFADCLAADDQMGKPREEVESWYAEGWIPRLSVYCCLLPTCVVDGKREEGAAIGSVTTPSSSFHIHEH